MKRFLALMNRLHRSGTLEFLAVVGALAGVFVAALGVSASNDAVKAADKSVVASNEAASAALRVAAEANEIERKHNKLSSRPILEFSYRLSGAGGEVNFSVVNRGLGPAIIDCVKVHPKSPAPRADAGTSGTSETCSASVHQMKALLPGELQTTLATTSLTRKQVIAVGQQVDLFRGTREAGGTCKDRLVRQAFFKNLAFVVIYRSLYEEDYELVLDYEPADDPNCRSRQAG